MIKVAEADPELFTGDLRTHAMSINPNQIEQFNEEGTEPLPEIGLNFACRQCHNDQLANIKTDEVLIEAANGYHAAAPVSAAESSAIFVDDITVEERGGTYVAVINGNLPDSCSTIDGVEQSVDGTTFSLTVSASRPGDALCAQALVPFTEEVELDTAGLEAGDYTVDVNGEISTTFSLS
jgi:hypothetical protein